MLLEVEKETTPMAFYRWITMILMFALWRTAEGSPELVQSDTIHLGGSESVIIEAHEPNHEAKLVFKDAKSGQVLQEISFNGLAGAPPSQVRFKVMRIQGLPDPLVLALLNANGASDCFYEPIPIARINGKFRRLTAANPEFATQGGFAIGSFRNRDVTGFAVWSFIWGPGESHYDRHQYRIRFYRWSGTKGEFISAGSRLTGRLPSADSVALSLGLGSYDVIDARTLANWFPEFRC